MGRDGVSGLDRGADESLLRGDQCHAAPDVLVHLLAAATAPARPYELVGEETAVVAFRQSRAPVRASGRRALLARLLTVKIAAAFALTAVGGATLAAAGGLPELPGTSGFAPSPAVPTDAPSPTPSIAAPSTRAPASVPRTPPAPATPSPHPSPESLCRVLIANPENGQAGSEITGLDSQALAALIALAGGKVAGVWPYCSRVLSSVDSGPAFGPAAAGPSSAEPNAGTGTGTGQPSDRPGSYDPSAPSDRRSHYPQPPQYPSPSPNQSGQFAPQTADRDTSPSPGSRSAQTSSPPAGRR